MNRRFTTVMLALMLSVMVIGVGSAVMVSESVYVHQPGDDSVEATVDFSAGTTAYADLIKDGSSVQSVQATGTAGNSTVLSIDTTGIQSGDYTLNVSSDDEANTTVSSTTVVSTRADVLNATSGENETLTMDVGFSGDKNASSQVMVTGPGGSTLYTETLTYDPANHSENSTILTTEFTSDSTDGNLTVVAETSPASVYDGMWVSEDSGGFFGIIGGLTGASNTQIMIAGAVLTGLLYARREEMI